MKSLFGMSLMLLLFAGPAFANAGGSSSGGSGGSTPQCNSGFTYDTKTQTCVKSSSMNDQQLIEQGRQLALSGAYGAALDTLSYVRTRTDATALTYIGYANRKLGRVDAGIAYYHLALAIDPNNLNTREYLGEGYVAAAQTARAVEQLNKLADLCGTDCDQYEQLELAIAGTPTTW